MGTDNTEETTTVPGSEIINNLIWFGAAVVVGLPILVGGLYYWARR